LTGIMRLSESGPKLNQAAPQGVRFGKGIDMRQSILVAVSALLLSACTTPQERAAAMQAEMDRIMVEYGPACTRLGYQPNSDAWRNCVLQLNTRDEITRYGYPTFYGGFGRSHWGGGGLWGPYW
jgi:hypothetical protein